MLVDKAGRRTLTLVGLGGMCCCAIAMTVGLKLQVCPPLLSIRQPKDTFSHLYRFPPRILLLLGHFLNQIS